MFGRQNWDEIVREVGEDKVSYAHANVQREDVEIWIRDYEESRVESRSARRVCFGDVTQWGLGSMTHHVE